MLLCPPLYAGTPHGFVTQRCSESSSDVDPTAVRCCGADAGADGGFSFVVVHVQTSHRLNGLAFDNKEFIPSDVKVALGTYRRNGPR